MSKETSAASTVTMGVALAMIISWERSHAILWAMLHGICGWFYVLWFAIWGRP